MGTIFADLSALDAAEVLVSASRADSWDESLDCTRIHRHRLEEEELIVFVVCTGFYYTRYYYLLMQNYSFHVCVS